MARSYETIKSEIQTQIRTYPSLNSFLFPEEGGSKVSVFNVIISSVAYAIMTFEILLDAALAELTDIAESTPSGSSKWVQNQIKLFQYGDIITFVNNVPSYNPVDPTHRIVTQCAVKQLTNGTILIKVAKGTSPSLGPLSTPELTALKNYYYGTGMTEGVGFAGVIATFINENPDRLMVQATVFYYGQFIADTVKTNVINAITAFLASFSNDAFDGTVFMIRLVDAIQSVEGVSRVNVTLIKARSAATPFASAATIDVQGTYSTVAGYIIPEDTAGQTLTDQITMTAEQP